MALNILRWDRSKLFWLLGILIPILVTLIVLHEPINSLLAPYLFTVIKVLFIITVILIVYLLFYKSINNIMWGIKYKLKFSNPIIAIIKEEDCIFKATKYTPYDWRDHFDKKYKTEIISCKEISNKYAVIVNPYGEVYPEEDLFSFRTFNLIIEFVKNGGIFVNVGGFAFYYGWDIETKRGPIPIADVYQFYGGEIKENRIELYPLQSIKGRTLTNGTLLFERLKITPTFGDTQRYKVYQTESDKRFIGNLEDVGETNIIEEFRCVREPVFRCKPLLRAKSEIYNEIYPLAAIPYRRGYFIIGGMNLDPKNDQDRKISNSAFLKSCNAIENIVERIKKGYIKPSLDTD
jgi:hypothetical protein